MTPLQADPKQGAVSAYEQRPAPPLQTATLISLSRLALFLTTLNLLYVLVQAFSWFPSGGRDKWFARLTSRIQHRLWRLEFGELGRQPTG